ncbi:50S ribosomal protein L17 [Pseudodesulfovibrio methanolicus]|uniref:Large ribosomal subunit protein bL17 n=1 Tax=Pseudodesulfovibrio methanolicus TaxID=3126690 RepID=A0ABZ2J0G4_9BACT
MRHRKSGRKLNRSNTHRAAMFKNMARALLTYEQIRTTEAKAKELRRIADKLITLAVRNDLHSRRQAYKVLGSHQMVQRLFDEIGPRFAEAGGGYTRIVKMAQPRKGDCAPMVIIELTKKAGETAAAAPAKEEPKKASKPAEKKEEPKKAPEKAEEKPEETAEETPEAAEKADEE